MDIDPEGNLSNIKDSQAVYTELTNQITAITAAFDGNADHAVEILLKISHSIKKVFNELLHTLGSLSQSLNTEIQTVYAAINDIEIALLQIIQSLRLAASAYSLNTDKVLDLDVTIGMAIQDQASALSSMIEVVLDITASNGDIPESLSLAAFLQTVINLSEIILGFSTNILVSINGPVSQLHTNMINILIKADAEITHVLQDSNMINTTISANLSTALNDLDADLVTIWSDKSVQMFDTLDAVVDELANTLNSMTTSLTKVGATVEPLFIDSINCFQMEIISLNDAISGISLNLEWIPNSVTVAAINVITAVNAILSLNGLLSATNSEHVAVIFEAQLFSVASTLNSLIYAVSRQIDNAFTSVLSSENLLKDLQSLAPIATNLADKLQNAVRVSVIALDQALDSVVSVEHLTWTPEDATALTNILSVLQNLTGRTQDTVVDVNMYHSTAALLHATRNAAGAADMVDATVESILLQFE